MAGFAIRSLRQPAAPATAPVRFTLTLPEGTIEPSNAAAPMWVPSPDGRYIAFPTAGEKGSLWVRELGSAEPRQLAKAANANYPFWSPDSQSIAYFGFAGIERVSIADGAVRTICETGAAVYNRSGGGGAWSPAGVVLFQTTGGLQQCPASGGAPSRVTELDAALQETSHTWPQFLPDGRRFLYFAHSENPENCAIYVQELGSKTRVRVMTSLTRALWAPPGWLLFARDETLLAQRFDPETLRLSGEPVTVEPSITVNDFNGRAAFAASAGVLVTRPALENRMSLVWRDRAGNAGRSIPLGGLHSNLRVSPDGRFASLNRNTRHPTLTNTWLVDLATGTPQRATFDAEEDDNGAAWSPDWKELAYTRRHGTIWRQPPGAADPRRIDAGMPAGWVRDWSPDGRLLVITDQSALKTFLVPLAGGGARQVLDIPERRTQHRISPDGKWIAITIGSGERSDVWVAAFPDFTDRRRISVNGGSFPVWRKDGRELYFLEPDGMLISVSLSPAPRPPQRLFRLGGVRRGYFYAALPDGRFLVLESERTGQQTTHMVTLNWTAGLKP
jgi:Tol biopolymer transport system component